MWLKAVHLVGLAGAQCPVSSHNFANLTTFPILYAIFMEEHNCDLKQPNDRKCGYTGE